MASSAALVAGTWEIAPDPQRTLAEELALDPATDGDGKLLAARWRATTVLEALFDALRRVPQEKGSPARAAPVAAGPC